MSESKLTFSKLWNLHAKHDPLPSVNLLVLCGSTKEVNIGTISKLHVHSCPTNRSTLDMEEMSEKLNVCYLPSHKLSKCMTEINLLKLKNPTACAGLLGPGLPVTF